MPNNTEVKFLVKKETYTFITCSSCLGSGKAKTRKFQSHTFSDGCRICKGTGREKKTHITEVSLMQALKEMGLIKEKA